MEEKLEKEGVFVGKRWLALVLAGVMAFGVCGCVKEAAEGLPSPGVEPVVLPSPSVEAVVTEEPVATPTTAPAAEPSEEAELFLAFLRGEVQAAVGDDFYNDLAYVGCNVFAHSSTFERGAWMGSEEISIRSLTELVKSSFNTEGMENLPDTQMSYVLLKTMGGREMLVVRSQSPIGMDEFTGCFVFGAYDGQLRLTYAKDSWSRSNTELHEGLIFSGLGSSGAGDNSIWRGYMDEDGHYKRVYEARILGGAWVAMNAHEVFDWGDTDWANDCESCLLTTEEGKFYDLDGVEGADLADIDPEKLALLRKYYKEQGMTEIDDAEKAMSAAEDAHGIKDTPVITDWTALELAK